MKTRFTPYYLELVYDSCLKSFWRKTSLAKFLRQCGVSENFIATWSEEESKRDFLDRLFAKLPKTDIGRKGLLQISRHLIEQRTFPDLTNWEDSAQKIEAAHDAVTRLRLYHTQQEEEFQSEEEKGKAKAEFRRRQEEVTRSQKNLQNLNDNLNLLGKNLGSQQAGYNFQTWFYELLDFSEIPNRKPYIHSGRQIDGSLHSLEQHTSLNLNSLQSKPM